MRAGGVERREKRVGGTGCGSSGAAGQAGPVAGAMALRARTAATRFGELLAGRRGDVRSSRRGPADLHVYGRVKIVLRPVTATSPAMATPRPASPITRCRTVSPLEHPSGAAQWMDTSAVSAAAYRETADARASVAIPKGVGSPPISAVARSYRRRKTTCWRHWLHERDRGVPRRRRSRSADELRPAPRPSRQGGAASHATSGLGITALSDPGEQPTVAQGEGISCAFAGSLLNIEELRLLFGTGGDADAASVVLAGF